jgi:histidine triad (HIT) family protein
MDCLFCKILSGEIPAELVYESETAVAFRDINSMAPTHVLVIPRKHISTINDIENDDELIIGSLYTAAREIAAREGIAEDGYRAVMNCNESAGQSVFHIHLHVMGGRSMGWPPWPSGQDA